MTEIAEFARAKVNLTLEVLGRRTDGYHEIASLVAFARGTGDRITLDTSKPVAVTVSGPFGDGIAGQNLIEVALRRLSDAAPHLVLGAVHLEKNLPVAAGIGGGSADAAAVLRVVRRANPDFEFALDWLAIARSLGADVPVCFENRASWMTGIGDDVQHMPGLPQLTAVLVNPLVPMPPDKTAQVFRALNAGAAAAPVLRPTKSFATAAELIDFMAGRGNALDAAACHIAPIIAAVKRALTQIEGCRYAAVSGSGPTCFGIFADHEAAAATIARAYPGWWVQAAILS